MVKTESHTAEMNGIDVHYISAGDPAAPAIIFLHGFPECGSAWGEYLTEFSSTHFAVAPDQRGYNLTSKPQDVAAYKPRTLAQDMIELIDKVSPRRSVTLVGHDWGASVAYLMAMLVPDRIGKLVVLNGVHPAPYRQALLTSSQLIENSAYVHVLRAPNAAAKLGANNCSLLFDLFSSNADMTWLTEQKAAAYLSAWKQPGALNAMCNWYRAMSPLPGPGDPIDAQSLPDWDKSSLRIHMPHMLIWGMRDKVLVPATYDGLSDYCTDLVIHEFADADHWVLHQKPAEVASLIRTFVS